MRLKNYKISWAAEETGIPSYTSLDAKIGNKKPLENQCKPSLQSFKVVCSRATRPLTVHQAEGCSQIQPLNRADKLSGLPTPLEALTNLSFCQGFSEKIMSCKIPDQSYYSAH